MATTQQLIADLSVIKSTPSGLVEWNLNSLQVVMEQDVTPLFVQRGAMQVADTTVMQDIPAQETRMVVVDTVGLFIWRSTGTPDMQYIFPAAGGGVWSMLRVPAITPDLEDLLDVTITSPTNGQVLTYNSATQKWVNGTAPGGVSALAQLSDVTITTPVSKNALVYDGTEWVNRDLVLADVSDVTVTTPAVGQSLIYNGSEWVNGDGWEQADWTASSGRTFIKNKPTIPSAQIQSDWTQANPGAIDFIKNKPVLALVATTGSYADLDDLPTLTLQGVTNIGNTTDNFIVVTGRNNSTGGVGIHIGYENSGGGVNVVANSDTFPAALELSATNSYDSTLARLALYADRNTAFTSTGSFAVDYSSDPTANFTGLSMVHKDYVDGLLMGGTLQTVTTAGNTTDQGIVVTGNTGISDYGLYVSVDSSGANHSGNLLYYADTLLADLTVNVNDVSGNVASLLLSTAGNSKFSSNLSHALDYDTDPTANFTGLSMVHKNYVDRLIQTGSTVLYSQAETTSISNTAIANSILASGAGSRTVPPNTFNINTIGRSIRITGKGYWTGTFSPPTLTMFVSFGTGSLSTSIPMGSNPATGFTYEIILVQFGYGSSAEFSATITVIYSDGASAQQKTYYSGIVVNVTTTSVIDVKLQFGTASPANAINTHSGIIELLTPPPYAT